MKTQRRKRKDIIFETTLKGQANDGRNIDVILSQTGGLIRTIGLGGWSYNISKESAKYCGSRQSGTGPRNYNRFVKAIEEWDKKTISHLWKMISKHKVDTWAV